MDRDSARKAAEVMLAYADGKEIEDTEFGLKWEVDKNPQFNWLNNNYRIKPTPTYRPFANAEECWEEMKKHEPFGWVKGKKDGTYIALRHIYDDMLFFNKDNNSLTPLAVMSNYTFADGSVFGKLTEEG